MVFPLNYAGIFGSQNFFLKGFGGFFCFKVGERDYMGGLTKIGCKGERTLL